MVHKLRPTTEKADALSRHVDHKEGVEHDNENVTLLKSEYFKVHTLCQGHLLIEGKELVARNHQPSRRICHWMRLLSKNEIFPRETSWKAQAK